MKALILIVLTMAMAVLFMGCAGAATNDTADTMQGGAYHKITAQEAKQMMTDNPKVVILDVRTAGEYAEKHIPGARLVPNETIGNTPIEGLRTDDVILVYCRTGHRSKQASDKLVKMGYKNIYDFGGITTWPYDTEPGAYEGI
ncbi:MAG: rhodanese-like domain-containing protein [Megasphaera sp.]|jgi:rhodanese-related sulfurtransferase|nr:rhodanese-like domain-containing protein [Megasphaera sp.]MCH4187820.1 rhodanese-like domain-containing protein [Megasphaera sp.]MCH4218007.1 rhodanese-like domain-containing protein [Megasphaera sp.]